MLELGKYKNQTVTTDDKSCLNGHICVIGESGAGKTVECQKLIACAVEQGATVVAFDLHGALSPDQIFWKYESVWNENLNDISAEQGIVCDLFSPMVYPDGTTENVADMIETLTDVFGGTIGVGHRQRGELRSALEFVVERGTYEKEGIRALDKALALAGNSTAEAVREKLHCVVGRNIFVQGETFVKGSKINVFRISKCSLTTQKIVSEVLLAYIWRLALAEQYKAAPIYIFVDEYQNLLSGPNSTLAQLISEGRKFGVNLILATQVLESGKSSAVNQRILQSGVKLYFKPAANKVNATAKLINPLREGEWARMLRTLGIGEFVADGNFLLDGWSRNEPLKVSAYEEKETSESESRNGMDKLGRGSVVRYR